MKPVAGEIYAVIGEKGWLQAKLACLLRYRSAVAGNVDENVAKPVLDQLEKL